VATKWLAPPIMTIIGACRNPWIASRRRPSLAPLLLPLLVLLAAGAGIFWLGSWARTTVVVLVRHAEPQASSGGDPDLSVAGERRVAALGGFSCRSLRRG
jgi:hypothetical protein